MRTIGFAGTAKNTGKTTTAQHVIQLCHTAGLVSALTSIGYDGENRDNITGLPKPRYFLGAGTYLATAETCLKSGSAGYTVLHETEIKTILGKVIIARIDQPGYVLLAGPNRNEDLQRIFIIFHDLGVHLTLVDGALNRIVPMIGCARLVVSTGAALDTHIATVAGHARALSDLFLPSRVEGYENGHGPARDRCHPGIRLVLDRGAEIELPTGSLLSDATFNQVLGAIQGPVVELVIPGACDPKWFAALLEKAAGNLEQTRFIFGSPLNLVASGNAVSWSSFFDRMNQQGQGIAYLEKTPLVLITVNPFYPRYLGRGGSYEAAEVDKTALLAAVRAQVPGLPVVDLRQPPLPDLLTLL